MKEKFEMKEAAFNRINVSLLATRISNNYPLFLKDEFLESVFSTLFTLELKERSKLIEQQLYTFLPKEYSQAIKILLASLPEKNMDLEVSGYEGFIIMPLCGYVGTYGVDEFTLSMDALKEMTKRFTAEFDIRFFIEAHYEPCMDLLKEWSSDENVHVRRLVSEGTRPRLPWAFQLKGFINDPLPVIELLSLLKDDTELYVRRSVSNNLNDISKDHPDLVVKTLKSWQNGTKEMQWLTSHALRTLLKAGNSDALTLQGYERSSDLSVDVELSTGLITLGESLEFSTVISSTDKRVLNLMVDFVIGYKKANGKLNDKVFKLSKKSIKEGESITLTKSHRFADFSTRKHYAGEHELAIIVNGEEYKRVGFELALNGVD